MHLTYLFTGRQIAQQLTSQPSSVPASLPHVPIIIPDTSESPDQTPVPPDLLNSTGSEPSTSGSYPNNNTEAKDLPAPEGIVKTYLEATAVALNEQITRYHQPDCYRINKSFWIVPRDRWFILQEPKSTATPIGPDLLYHPRVL
jgi:hypothetical protein